ncbi:zinc-binding alcohol dehydrogenase family protein [Bdellovibrio sp. NC01]|uniref:zinc-binding alcohol dehydrogenase family protein n=1 Tax=Bdellovibrio sp. NC01 TaxID=2220073 RepID=UPI001159D5A2|nr:zinc-binding alcohol dehydrogenase family protein [Bdellovibrio sp. NC01]QDK37275.1 zinc-binding alcohol dehydrogenase family protein [Bdellovibrio sp. NC01]
MKVIGYLESLDIENPESLLNLDLPTPEPGPMDILVRVKAVSVNPVDTKIRKNTKPNPGEPKILGWDAAGIVEKIGSKVQHFKVGDAVYYAGSLTRPGTNAEFHLVDERIAALKPQKLSFEEAAALPLTSITAYEALFDRMNVLVNDQEYLLILGGSGGVGSMAIQLAKKETRLKVIATASRASSQEWCRKLGADIVIDHNKDLHQQLREHGIDTVKYIFSTTHSDVHRESIEKMIAPQGTFCLIDDPPNFPINGFKRKSVGVHWEFMFTRSMFETPDMIKQHQLLTKIAGMIDRAEIQTTINHIFEGMTAENFRKAHQMIESHKTIGKIVIKF